MNQSQWDGREKQRSQREITKIRPEFSHMIHIGPKTPLPLTSRGHVRFTKVIFKCLWSKHKCHIQASEVWITNMTFAWSQHAIRITNFDQSIYWKQWNKRERQQERLGTLSVFVPVVLTCVQVSVTSSFYQQGHIQTNLLSGELKEKKGHTTNRKLLTDCCVVWLVLQKHLNHRGRQPNSKWRTLCHR